MPYISLSNPLIIHILRVSQPTLQLQLFTENQGYNIQALSIQLSNATNHLSNVGGLRCRKVFFKEGLLNLIPSDHGPRWQIVHHSLALSTKENGNTLNFTCFSEMPIGFMLEHTTWNSFKCLFGSSYAKQ